MKLPRLRSRKKSQIIFHEGAYSHLRSKPVERGLPKLPRITPQNYRFRYSLFVIVPLLAMLLAALGAAIFSDIFHVETVTVQTNGEPGGLRLILEEEFIGQHLYSFSVDEVQQFIRERHPSVSRVYVRKVPPGKLEVDVQEYIPTALYLDFNSFAIIDENGNFQLFEKVAEPLLLSDEELAIINGTLGIESEYVQKAYLAEIKEEDIAEFNWDEVAFDQKEAVRSRLEAELLGAINTYFQNQKTNLHENFAGVDLFIFFTQSEDALDLAKSSKNIADTFTIIDQLESLKDIEVESIKWINSIRLELTTTSGKKTIWGSIEPGWAEEQLKRFEDVFNDVQTFETLREIDLRTKKFAGS